MPGGKTFTFGLFCGSEQIGFQCFANYVPHRRGTKIIYHSNRTVIHPDYVGLGLGMKLIDETSRIMEQRHDCRIMGKFSSVPVYKAVMRDKNWVLRETQLKFDKMNVTGNMTRRGGFRDKGIKTWSFEYIAQQ